MQNQSTQTRARCARDLTGSDPLRRSLLSLVAIVGLFQLAGCAAVTNPVANGVPVHMVPDELLAPSKEGFEPIDLTLLRQQPPVEYLLAAGDTLGIYVEGILGDPESPPPVSVPDVPDLSPSIGYPFPIRSDGTVSLPFIGAVDVAGLSIEGAERKVIDAYLQKRIVPQEEEGYRIIVTLQRPRYERILVVRDDGTQSSVSFSNAGLVGFGSETTISDGRSATGQVVELPAYENDVLNALARTGGLPGPTAKQEVLIYRKGRREQNDEPTDLQSKSAADLERALRGGGEVIRVPLVMRPGLPPAISRDDIILKTGDIVTIRAREPELYYTGGLIPARETQLPYDRDVSVVKALLMAQGPLVNGGVSTNNLSGSIVASGLGAPSPSLLSVIRKTPSGSQIVIRVDLNDALRDPRHDILVQAGDLLILQENTDESLTRYFTSIYQMDFFFRYLNRADASGTGSVILP